MPRGVLVDSTRGDQAGVLRRASSTTGPRKKPTFVFSRHGRHRHRGGRRDPSRAHRARPLLDDPAPHGLHRARTSSRRSASPASTCNRLTPILSKLARLFVKYDMTLAEINPLAQLEDGTFVAVDAHIDMENEGRAAPEGAARRSSASATRRRARRARRPQFEIEGEKIDAVDHRGVAGNVTEFDGNLGLVIGAGGGSLTLFDAVRSYGGKPANYCEIGGNPTVTKAKNLTKLMLSKPGVEKIAVMMNDRLEHARRHRRPRRDQGVRRARLRPGRDDRGLPHPGRLGGRRLQDPREVRRRVLRPHRVDVRGGQARRREDRREGDRRS